MHTAQSADLTPRPRAIPLVTSGICSALWLAVTTFDNLWICSWRTLETPETDM